MATKKTGKSKTTAKPKKPAAPKTAAWMTKTATVRGKAPAAKRRGASDHLVFQTARKTPGQRTVGMFAEIRRGNRDRVVRQVIAFPSALVDQLRDRRDCDGPWSSAVGALALWALSELERQGLRLEIRDAGDVAGETP